jgi:hypothetical protein
LIADHTQPVALWVTPSSGEDLNPLQPLSMSVYLSARVRVADRVVHVITI